MFFFFSLFFSPVSLFCIVGSSFAVAPFPRFAFLFLFAVASDDYKETFVLSLPWWLSALKLLGEVDRGEGEVC